MGISQCSKLRWTAAVSMLCGCGAAHPATQAPAPPPASATASPMAKLPAAAAPPTTILDGTCTCERREGAAYEAEAVERHVIVVITKGHVSEARDILSSGAGGVDTSSFAGEGPAVTPGQAVEVVVELQAGAGRHPLRFSVDGDSITLDDGTTGRCQWSAPAAATPSTSATAGAATAPTVETPEAGHVVVRIGAAVVDCTTNLTPHAGMSECQLKGSAGSAIIGHGNSDDTDELMCSRKPVEYQFEHGGGWDISDDVMTKVGAEGVVARLADGVRVWLSPELAHIEVDAPGGSVVLDVDVSAMKITPRPGAHVANTAAKVVVDLGTPHPEVPGCDAK